MYDNPSPILARATLLQIGRGCRQAAAARLSTDPSKMCRSMPFLATGMSASVWAALVAAVAAGPHDGSATHGGAEGGCEEAGGEDLIILQVRSRYANSSSQRGSFLKDLESLNSRVTYAADVHEIDPTDWLKQCVYYFKLGGFQKEDQMNPKYSTYYLKDKASGLCTITLAAAFENMQYNYSVQKVLQDHDLLTAEIAAVKDMRSLWPCQQ